VHSLCPFFARAKEIRVEASPGSMEFTVDGEVIGIEPAVFAVMPKALKVVVGPGYAPEL
jgi:diacylglycerol kinase family enzyme